MYVNDMQTLYFSIRDLNTWRFYFLQQWGCVSWNQYPWMPERLTPQPLLSLFPCCISTHSSLSYQNTELKLN